MKKIRYFIPILLLLFSSCEQNINSSINNSSSSSSFEDTSSVTIEESSSISSEESSSNSSSSSSFTTSSSSSSLISSSSEKLSYSVDTDYYNGININATGATLMNALHKKIKSLTSVSYDSLKEHFKTTDNNNGYFWDMYSNTNYPITQEIVGNYKKEGDGWNREHSIPKSWFNDEKTMLSDIFHLYPTDAKVNGVRSNYAFGEVTGKVSYTSTNGCKLGSRSGNGPSTVFEPCDEYKGDFARTYFYFATCYMDKTINKGNGSYMFTGSNSYPKLTTYSIDLLLKWDKLDPVSQKEIDRNEACYKIQKNRNPFIDYPSFSQQIWG